MRWFVYFVFLAQTICKTKLEMSALLLRKSFKTNTVIQINDIWVWAICKAVILSSFLEKATSEWSVWGIRDYYCRGRPAARIQHTVWLWEVDSLDGLRKGVGLHSSPTVMSSHVLIFHSFYQSLHCGRHTWNFLCFFVFVLNLKGLKEHYLNIEQCWARYSKNVINCIHLLRKQLNYFANLSIAKVRKLLSITQHHKRCLPA